MSDYGYVGEDLIGSLLDDDLIEGDGTSELVGYDDDFIEGGEIVGARRRGASGIKRAVLARNAALVQQNPLKRRRRYLLGFAITSLAASVSQAIAARPQNLFRSERLVIPSDIAFDLGIVSITVGTSSQFAEAVEVPAAVFTEVAQDTNVMFDTAEIGNQIVLEARNKSAATVSFTGAMVGSLAKQ